MAATYGACTQEAEYGGGQATGPRTQQHRASVVMVELQTSPFTSITFSSGAAKLIGSDEEEATSVKVQV